MADRCFGGVFIPSAVWLDDRLNATDKVAYGEIASRDGDAGYCVDYESLADICGCGVCKASQSVRTLVECGHVYQEPTDSRVLRSRYLHPMGDLVEPDGQMSLLPTPKTRRRKFSPPSPSEVEEYAKTVGCVLDGESFCDYYEARGWKYKGNVAMKDWKAAVRTWAKNGYGGTTRKATRDDFAAYA